MASLSFLLGMVPATEKVESADDQLRADYQAFQDYENSDELKHYLELEKEIKSSDFTLRKKKITSCSPRGFKGNEGPDAISDRQECGSDLHPECF